MAVSSLLGAAASFLYAVSSLFGGTQNNNGALERTLVQNFQSTPTFYNPRVSSLRSGPPFSATNNYVPSSSAIPSSSNNTEVYAVM